MNIAERLYMPPGSVWTPKLDGTEVLYLPLWHPRTRLSPFTSFDRNRHVCTVVGATYGKYGRTFAGGDDYIEIPSSSTQLNFTSENFSFVWSGKFTSLPATSVLFRRGADNTDGYAVYVTSAGTLYAKTDQSGANQTTRSDVGAITTDTFYTIGLSRVGAAITLYKNGVDFTGAAVSHINPTTCARSFLIGIHSDKTLYPLDGITGELHGYSRNLSASEHMRKHQEIKWRYES